MDLDPEGGRREIHFLPRELQIPNFENEVCTTKGPRSSPEHRVEAVSWAKVNKKIFLSTLFTNTGKVRFQALSAISLTTEG